MKWPKEKTTAIHKRTIETHGLSKQTAMIQEEATELALALHKYINRGGSSEDVITELADMRSMLEQAEIIFGVDAIDKEQDRKLDRMDERLKITERDPFKWCGSCEHYKTACPECDNNLGGYKAKINTAKSGVIAEKIIDENQAAIQLIVNKT